MAASKKFRVTVLEGHKAKRGCPHTLPPSKYKKCAACGEWLCKDCRRPALLPGKLVCKNGCPEWTVEQTEKSFHSRYTLALKNGGRA